MNTGLPNLETPTITEKHIEILRFVNATKSLPTSPQNIDIAAELYAAKLIAGYFRNGDVFVSLTPAGINAARPKT